MDERVRRVRYWWRSLPRDSKGVAYAFVVLMLWLGGALGQLWSLWVDWTSGDGFAMNAAVALIGVAGTLLAVGVALYTFGVQRALDRVGGLPLREVTPRWFWLMPVLMVASIVLGILAIADDARDSFDAGSHVIAGQLALLGLATALLVPSLRFASGRQYLVTFAQRTVHAVSERAAMQLARGHPWTDIQSYIWAVAGSPYRKLRLTFSGALDSGDDDLASRVLMGLMRRHDDLGRHASDATTRGMVLGAALRSYRELASVAVQRGRTDIVESSIDIVPAMVSSAIARDPSWQAVLQWERDLRDLAKDLPGVPHAAARLMVGVEQLQLDHLKLDPGEAGQDISNQWHQVSHAYVDVARGLAEAALESGSIEVARRAADAMETMAYRVFLSELEDDKKERYLTWTLDAARERWKAIARKEREDVWRVSGIHMHLLVEAALKEAREDIARIPLVIHSHLLVSLLDDGIVPWSDWNDLRVALTDYADVRTDRGRHVMQWMHAMLSDAVSRLRRRHNAGHLVGHGMVEVAKILHWVYPKITLAGKTAIRAHFDTLYNDLKALDKEVGGVVETTIEWPGRPEDRLSRNLIRASWDTEEE